MVHLLAWHRRHWVLDTALAGVERHFLVAVVDGQGTVSADHLDPGVRVVRIAERQDPAGADRQRRTVVEGD